MPRSQDVRYAIVAAGMLSRRATVGTAFNGLTIIGSGPGAGLAAGDLKFTYATYAAPARGQFSFQTIVKVLPVVDDRQLTVVPAFVRFDDDGFVVRLNLGTGVPLDQRVLDSTVVMVEVSEYGKVNLP